jgi:hypothetical protein
MGLKQHNTGREMAALERVLSTDELESSLFLFLKSGVEYKRRARNSSTRNSSRMSLTTTIMDVMTGDFTNIKTLISVSRCSKQANKTLNPIIARKTENAREMRQLMFDIFPTIKDVPTIEDADVAMLQFLGNMPGMSAQEECRAVLLRIASSGNLSGIGRETYYLPAIGNVSGAAAYYCVLLIRYFMGFSRPVVLVIHSIGHIMDLSSREPEPYDYIDTMRKELRTCKGRKNILAAIHEWRLAGPQYAQHHRLNAVADIARGSFAVVRDQITSNL